MKKLKDDAERVNKITEQVHDLLKRHVLSKKEKTYILNLVKQMVKNS